MKCIRAIKATKQTKIGELKRVSDKEADSATKDGYWQYVAKSEWKYLNKKKVEEEKEAATVKVETAEQSNKSNKKHKSK